MGNEGEEAFVSYSYFGTDLWQTSLSTHICWQEVLHFKGEANNNCSGKCLRFPHFAG